jgi:inosose dehydratase
VTANQESSGATAPRHRPRVAANPIPYWARDGKVDKSKEVFDQAFADFAAIGFTAVKADIPDGMTPTDYTTWLNSYGLSPALSLFNSPLDETIDITDEIERAKRFAADQTALGLDRTMISSMAIPARLTQPAIGADYHPDRLALAIDNAGILCQVLQSHGLRPLHHSHIGGVFETETEITQLLDTLGPDIIGFGPDTGHLQWAGINPATLITRYADRIGGIHIKDLYPDYLNPTTGHGLTYHQLGNTKRLWAEPGLGIVDFTAILNAIPPTYDGDYMIEIDVPSVNTRYHSHQISYTWATQHLNLT